MGCTQNVGKWEVVEIGRGWESPGIRLAKILKDPRFWVRDCEVGKRVEAAQRGRSCGLFQLLTDHRTAIDNFDAAEENIKAICDGGKAGVLKYCGREESHGRQTSGFVE